MGINRNLLYETGSHHFGGWEVPRAAIKNPKTHQIGPVSPARVWGRENQNNWWCVFQSESGRHKTREEVDLSAQVVRQEFLSREEWVILFFSMQYFNGLNKNCPHQGRTICFTQSTDSTVTKTLSHATTNLEIMFDQISAHTPWGPVHLKLKLTITKVLMDKSPWKELLPG